MVEVDKKTFNLSRVGALPFTKNIKYNSFRWRGIIELKKSKNEGFSDYILTKKTNIKKFKEQNVFSNTNKNFGLTINNFKKNKILKLMLENQLPYGEINNIPWCQFKCLIRDSNESKKILDSIEYKTIKKKLEIKYKGLFSPNLPDKDTKYNPLTLWNYCAKNEIIPIYNFSEIGNNNLLINSEILNKNLWNDKIRYGDSCYFKLKEETDEIEDILKLKKDLKEEEIQSHILVSFFLYAFEIKYGEKKAKFFADHILKDYLTTESKIESKIE